MDKVTSLRTKFLGVKLLEDLKVLFELSKDSFAIFNDTAVNVAIII